ncbi:hypothetical protein MHB85_20250 [Paenibacillus sp. FSL K6-4396]|uniref:hypothetical protein n=1 Tax=Paenibacillus sp. FSL K6-4396 TaxID=2921506 RepID=UPI0030FB8C40
MAAVTKRFSKGTFATTGNTNVYIVPAGAYAIVKAVTLCNKSAADAVVTLSFGGTEVIYQHTVKAKDTITIPFLDQVINSGESIIGIAGTANVLNYYISGKEVT